jgi:hypothetical protein
VRRTRTRTLAPNLVLALAAAALIGSGASGAAPSMEAIACSLPHDELLRIWRGTDPLRSGDIIAVPQQPNFLGANFPHSGPWDYLQEVPLLWYGPGHVPALGEVPGRVTLADVPATQAKMIGFPFEAPDGKPLREVLEGGATQPPSLIVTLVWDGGGRSVLDTWEKDWPFTRSLIPKGIWYDDAEVGSSPSITPATHATLGTGAFPFRTLQVDTEFRIGGEIVRSGGLGPALLAEPTLGDLYDRASDNDPVIGVVGSVTWHLNMMSHGRMWGGGDRDIAVLRSTPEDEGAEGKEWNLAGKNEPFYRIPDYVNDVAQLDEFTPELDREDGALDGKWRTNSIAQYEGGWDTPARVPYETAVVGRVIADEGFGDDEVTDMLFVNYKNIDHVGHVWSTNSPEMRDTVRWQDDGLRELVGILNREVGRREWVLLVTADHGHQFDPAVTGAFQISPGRLEDDLNAEFDDGDSTPAVLKVRTSQIYMNARELEDMSVSMDDAARFVLDYTKGQSSDGKVDPGETNDRLFSAVFPSSVLSELSCLPETLRP